MKSMKSMKTKTRKTRGSRRRGQDRGGHALAEALQVVPAELPARARGGGEEARREGVVVRAVHPALPVAHHLEKQGEPGYKNTFGHCRECIRYFVIVCQPDNF